ncbi:MAG: hypothetical protein ABWZ17_10055 [Candidatus Binatia bacterium]
MSCFRITAGTRVLPCLFTFFRPLAAVDRSLVVAERQSLVPADLYLVVAVDQLLGR